MYDTMTDLELIARHRIRDRRQEYAATRRGPAPTRRARLAGRLRRVADRIDG